MTMLPATYVPGFHNEEAVRKMVYNKLGATELMVSKLGLGGATFSALFGKFDEDKAIDAIRKAIKLGVNYIDTAPYYGQGRSEEVIGKALQGIPRQAYYIATKVARYETETSKMFNFTAEKTKWSVDNSLKLLGLDYVDIIQIHDIDFDPNLEIVLKETLPTLQEAVQAGKARFIGVTGYTLSILKEAADKSTVPIATVLSYARNILIDNSLQKYIVQFQALGLGVINGAGPAMGLLTNAGPQSWHPCSNEVRDTCAAAAKYCKERGVELGRLAVYHTMSHSGPSTHLVGMNTHDLILSNLDLIHNGITELEKQTLQEINKKFFSKLTQGHWEGVEWNDYQEKLKNTQE